MPQGAGRRSPVARHSVTPDRGLRAISDCRSAALLEKRLRMGLHEGGAVPAWGTP